MARKIALIASDGSSAVLNEDRVALEEELQELVKRNPELLPYEDFDLSGPLLVVSRETRVRSGAADLIALAPSGAFLLVEFKRGKENPDARHALAQLLDYGSHLWQTSYDDLDSLAVTYFCSSRCEEPDLVGRRSLEDAARHWWRCLPDFDFERFRDQVSYRLTRGVFEYVLAARDFPDSLERTVMYLNDSMESRFYVVELVRFSAGDNRAYEARTLWKPVSGRPGSTAVFVTETEFLGSIRTEACKNSLEDFFQWCRLQQLSFEWGTRGSSIRLSNRDRSEPISIAWVFPEGAPGWMGLRNFTFGFDSNTASSTPSLQPALDDYAAALGRIKDGVQVNRSTLTGTEFDEDTFPHSVDRIKDALGPLVIAASQ